MVKKTIKSYLFINARLINCKIGLGIEIELFILLMNLQI